MLTLSDVIKVKESVWKEMFSRNANVSKEPPSGPVFWISPVGIHRVMIKGCGWQFKQEDVEWLWTDIDIMELE